MNRDLGVVGKGAKHIIYGWINYRVTHLNWMSVCVVCNLTYKTFSFRLSTHNEYLCICFYEWIHRTTPHSV